MADKKTVAEFGSWKSPITSKITTDAALKFSELHVDVAPGHEDVCYWSELRCNEGGRFVVCSKKRGEANLTAWTSASFNARTTVHEYGGGAFFVYAGTVYFSNFSDQGLYVQKGPSASPERLSPEDKAWRYADGHYSPKLRRLYSVREDHCVGDDAKDVVNTVVVVDPSTKHQQVLASGCDFYSSPRVSPDGKTLAWVQWNHPNMPWDDTEIWLADLNETGDSLIAGSQRKVAGGAGNSVMHPRWTPDNQLIYVGDQSDWWNLYHVTATGEHVNLLPRDQETLQPHWMFANYGYDIDPSGQGNIVTTFKSVLGVLNMKTKAYREFSTGFASHSKVQYGHHDYVYCIASDPRQPSVVLAVHVPTGKVEILHKSGELPVDKGYLTEPQEISWPTANNKTSYGFFYSPQNKDYIGPKGSLPPLLVKVHGGPTSACGNSLDMNKQYFTSRGFAILDVNYRGSTGYGRQFRNEMRGNWGVCDIEDASSGARYLADTHKVDGNKLCIDGGSAGGYTTLACLAFNDVFKAGASHYGVADIGILAAEIHKFESRYFDLIVAPYTDACKHIYDERSPIKHIERFSCPVIFFQGDEDKVVPPNQAEMMFNVIKAKGIPCALVLFEGEQHGFLKAENIQCALDGEFYFFSKVFGFSTDVTCDKITIENLK